MRASIQRKAAAAMAALAASVLLVTLGAGIAWALDVDCAADPAAACPGTNAADVIRGEDANDGTQGARDVIEAKRGSDDVEGEAGNDRISGGKGADGTVGDQLDGGEGNDLVDGGPGDDGRVQGSDGNDTVLGGPGSDESLDGDEDNDTVDGGEGNEVEVFGGSGRDRVSGGPGNDEEVRGGSGDDTVDGGPGDDGLGLIFGGVRGDAGVNTVRGGPGDDLIFAAASSLASETESIFGQEDDDTIEADDGVKDTIDCGDGNDTVDADATDNVNGNCETVT